MEAWFDHLFLSRLQFALTTGFHILWPLLSIGLSLFLVLMEALWLKTGEVSYYHHCRFWSRLFILNFAVGVASGLPLQFQFGANWSRFSAATGGFFGHLLGFEATLAFMLEAAFLGIMLSGWKRVPRGLHFFSTCMVALGASLSAFWIMVANSWMQTPAGGTFIAGRFLVTDYWQAVFNPDMPWSVLHMWVACLETTLFVIGGISAWCLLRKQQPDFFARSFKIAFFAAILIAPLQVFLGDASGRAIAVTQPAKVAAIESHWQTNPQGQGAPWKPLAWPDAAKQDNAWALEVPYGLSLLLTHSLTGRVQGLRDFPREDRPPVVIPFYSFRVMAGVGFFLAFLMLWTLWVWYQGRLNPAKIGEHPKLLYAWVAAIPLGYVAVETGWITREVGRQPWVIYGLLRTSEAASPLPAGAVATSLLAYALIYALLFLGFLIFARRLILKGPDLTLVPPARPQPGTKSPTEGR